MVKLKKLCILILLTGFQWINAESDEKVEKAEKRHHHDDHDDHDDHDHDDDSYYDDDNGRPRYCPKKTGMFPNPNDCTTYYNCVAGTPIVMLCAPGLLFDHKKKLCNFPNQVKCKSDCRGRDGLFPSQHRCDEFVLCSGNRAKRYRCKKGLYFDPNLNVCNYRDQVICSLPGSYNYDDDDDHYKGKKRSRKKYNKRKHRDDYEEHDDTGHYQHDKTGEYRHDDDGHGEKDNKKNKGKAYVFVSKGGSNVGYGTGRSNDRSSSSEEDSSKVRLGQKYKARDDKLFEETGESVKQVPPESSSQKSVCPKPRGLFAHTELCHVYYQCWDNEISLKTCPQNMLFDMERHTCLDLREVFCGSRKVPKVHFINS